MFVMMMVKIVLTMVTAPRSGKDVESLEEFIDITVDSSTGTWMEMETMKMKNHRLTKNMFSRLMKLIPF